ncbi:DNA-binding LytR/AlgR family response regulator [Lachnospiraceae bacterium PM6-15]|uniref:LytR/AlgR family response regulator transcription factor n=1 Tax=Ohessyouella blattaphilus TaxID=2949333 RepID=UPI003E1F2584
MVKIAICDDIYDSINIVEKKLYELSQKIGLSIDTDVYHDGKELADFICQGARYEMIFLDIEMKNENGLTAAFRIREVDHTVLIIYVSSHEEYTKQTFEVDPFRFIKKPIDDQLFAKYFSDAIDKLKSFDECYNYKYNNVYYRIRMSDIVYFKSIKRKVQIYTDYNSQEELVLYKKLNLIEAEIGKRNSVFIRVHQSYLVNYNHIFKMSYDHVTLHNGEILPISEDRRKNVRKQYCLLGDDKHELTLL